ncbi:MAG: hypothetical protein M1492_12280 [Gammaproteobacteria bacterium]|nr:hypothetical protein [Gammaproteobacteria bacterium]
MLAMLTYLVGQGSRPLCQNQKPVKPLLAGHLEGTEDFLFTDLAGGYCAKTVPIVFAGVLVSW